MMKYTICTAFSSSYTLQTCQCQRLLHLPSGYLGNCNCYLLFVRLLDGKRCWYGIEMVTSRKDRIFTPSNTNEYSLCVSFRNNSYCCDTCLWLSWSFFCMHWIFQYEVFGNKGLSYKSDYDDHFNNQACP